LPARIAFQVASRTDSRVVLDEMGADKLLGNGDMLFLWPGTSTLLRGQGTYVTDDEINRVVDFVGAEEPQFVSELMQLKTPASEEAGAGGGKLPNRDELYEAAVDVVVREGRGSVSLLQRALGIGYGRAARLVDFMAEDGIVGDYNGSQAREVLISIEQWAQMTGAAPAPAAPEAPRNRRVLSLSDSEPAADVAKPARAKRNKSTASAAPKTKATAGARENMEDEETEDFARSPGASAADDDWDDDAEESEIDAGLDDEAALDADHDDASYTEEDEDESSPFATRNDDRDENDDHHERDDADHGGSPRRSLRTRAS
jgi:S-DNA-T family DNA segregation ATPase FtsK/SpoIIIE